MKAKEILLGGLILVSSISSAYSEELIAKSEYFSVHADKEVMAEALLEDLNLDELYLQVCDILDIHIYDLRITLKITSDKLTFYSHEEKTIYISSSEFDRYKLGHEISHAIINNYFVITPSVKLQEILCGYVEYTLRKDNETK